MGDGVIRWEADKLLTLDKAMMLARHTMAETQRQKINELSPEEFERIFRHQWESLYGFPFNDIDEKIALSEKVHQLFKRKFIKREQLYEARREAKIMANYGW
jgi:hypothetical protein